MNCFKCDLQARRCLPTEAFEEEEGIDDTDEGSDEAILGISTEI